MSAWHDGSLRNFNPHRERQREGDPFDDSDLKRYGYSQTAFNYELPDGTLLYQQNRYDPPEGRPGVDQGKKKFLPCRPVDVAKFDRNMNIGDRVFGPGERRVIYNWPAIMRAGPGSTVFVCEGETNANDLIKAGLLATTVVSHTWTEECSAALTGYDCIILEDADDDGINIAVDARKHLAKTAKSIRVVPTYHLWTHLDPEKAGTFPPLNSDVTDWIYYGGDPAKLIEICREIPVEGEIIVKPHDFPAEDTIPMWDWLYGKHLLRDTVSGTAALGGSGKTSLSIGEALAMAAGKFLYRIQVPRPLRVLLINLEDNRNAMDKRIAATMRHHHLKTEDIGERLFIKAKGEFAFKFKIASQLRSGTVGRNEQVIKGLIDFLIKNKIDVLSVDPFVSTHGVNENDNSAIREVVDCYSDIAEAAKCAVHLWHHSRKANSQAATVDSARGASSFVDACRSIRILETMTKEEGQKLKIEHPGYYFRGFNGKLNFAPPMDRSDWFKFVSVTLDNAGPLFGDDIGVVEAWQHPGVKEPNLSPDVLARIMEAVGPQPRWREDIRADMWVGKAIAGVINLDPSDDAAAIKGIIKKLKKMRALKETTGKDAKRQEKTFIVADDWVAPESGPTKLNEGSE